MTYGNGRGARRGARRRAHNRYKRRRAYYPTVRGGIFERMQRRAARAIILTLAFSVCLGFC